MSCPPVLSYQASLGFDPSACAFARPRWPLLPRWQAGHWAWQAAPELQAPGGWQSYSRARYALRAALAAAGVSPGSRVLAPAYHCRTLIDPALTLGAEVLLYPLTHTLQPLADALEPALQAANAPKALVLTHFLGQALPDEVLSHWVERAHARGIAVVEDCSHLCIPALWRDPKVLAGRAGDYAVASHYKFFAGSDGAALWWQSGRAAPAAPRPGGIWAGLKGLAATLDPRQPPPLAGTEQASLGEDRLTPGAQLSPHYRPEHEGQRALWSSDRLRRHTQLDALVARRRAHYAAWQTLTVTLQRGRPLWSSQPAVPYAYPLLLDAPVAERFARLKRQGLPMWRWDDMAVSGCPVAQDFRLRLVHLPCHQSLSEADMAAMTSLLRAELGAAA